MRRRIITTHLLAVLALALCFATGANAAASPAPGWEVSSLAQPTNFSAGDNTHCQHNNFCDRYVVTITNVGAAATNGTPITVADTLPEGLTLVGLVAQNLENDPPKLGWSCDMTTAKCTYEGTVAAGGTLGLYVEVEVHEPAVAARVRNAVTVSGGGAAPVSSNEPLTVSNTIEGSSAPFGISTFALAAHDPSGALDAQAADHPFGVTTTLDLNTDVEEQANGKSLPVSTAPPRDLVAYVPLGLIGDPTAAADCTEAQLVGNGASSATECPKGSQVGSVVLIANTKLNGSISPTGNMAALFNMVPEHGYPAQFGFKLSGVAVPLYARVVHTASGYALRVGTPGIPTTLSVEGVALTFFGNPREADGEPSGSRAFFTNPQNCAAGPLRARAEADSWANPGQWVKTESVAYPRVTGCDLLQFEPGVELHPEVTQAEAPSGYQVTIKVPQTPAQFPVLATPDLKDVTMTLPEGMTISPGGGQGLEGCQASGPEGIDIPSGEHTPSEAGEGEALGPDGMSHLTPGHCPAASQIGTVEIHTPVLENPLEGHLYIAQPKCGGAGQAECTAADAGDGNLFGLYLQAEGAGVVVKLKGSVSVDPVSGRITARFLENPQLPVSEVSLSIKGGARAPLANPRQCGPASANADLAPWSAPVTPDAIVQSSPFQVDWNGATGDCPASVPFTPSIQAGSTAPQAGRFSPFTFTIGRGDRQQDLARVQERMPAGLLGMLKVVAQCPESPAAQGACPESSRIGTINVAAGSGSAPLWVQGRVYLTGPYGGAPFGLSIVVPAVAGPFNLGNVVVRSRIDIDPSTSAITVTSDPLPQFRDGVPLRIQTLNITIDRPGFTFNPTDCSGKQISASVEAEQGASANVSAPFAVEGCKSLPFKPSFKVSTRGKASKASGASLSVSVSLKGGPQAGGGEANIRSVRVELPKQLPARLTTLQKACVAKVFEANPALCPKESDVGSARAVTPVLAHPLVGPAYLVSHGGAAFPDLEVVLQGEGIVLVLDGQTNIKRGITSSDFAMVPDAPVSSFSLTLPQGKFSALTSNVPAKAKFSLCGQVLKMPTTITGQNGVVVKQATKIGVAGCPKAKKKHTVKHKQAHNRRPRAAS